VNEIADYDDIEQRVKDEVGRISSRPEIVDILFDKGEDAFKAAILTAVSKNLTTEIDNAIELGKKTAKKLKK